MDLSMRGGGGEEEEDEEEEEEEEEEEGWEEWMNEWRRWEYMEL